MPSKASGTVTITADVLREIIDGSGGFVLPEKCEIAIDDPMIMPNGDLVLSFAWDSDGPFEVGDPAEGWPRLPALFE